VPDREAWAIEGIIKDALFNPGSAIARISPDEARESWQARAVVKILADAGYSIVRTGSTETEWGYRFPDGHVHYCAGGEGVARYVASRADAVAVRRTVTYGPWEVVTGD